MRVKRVLSTLLAAVMVAATLVGCGGAGGSDLSSKNVTCIVPYDAGGGTDVVMRALADAAKGSFKSITVTTVQVPAEQQVC